MSTIGTVRAGMQHPHEGRTAFEPFGDGRWRCPITELVTVSTPKHALWRVFSRRYRSPLNPPRRTGERTDAWCRFDVAGRATLYGASSQRGAYVESLAYAQVEPGSLPLDEIFPDVDADDDPVADEWRALFHMAPRQVPATWRTDRRLAEVVLTNHDHYVDLASSDTLGVLRRSAHAWAPKTYRENTGRIDLASITGGDRPFTHAAAEWLSQQALADGVPARGVRYLSKHGGDLPCWAVWIPVPVGHAVDETVANYAWTAQETPIDDRDVHLQWAARQLGITVR